MLFYQFFYLRIPDLSPCLHPFIIFLFRSHLLPHLILYLLLMFLHLIKDTFFLLYFFSLLVGYTLGQFFILLLDHILVTNLNGLIVV